MHAESPDIIDARRRVMRQAGMREIRWVAPAMGSLLVVFGILDSMSHLDDGSSMWRLVSSLLPALLCAALVALLHVVRVADRYSGLLFTVVAMAVGASLVYTYSRTAFDSDLCYLVIMVIFAGAFAISMVEFIASVTSLGGAALVAVVLVDSQVAGDGHTERWFMLLLVAAVASTSIHLARSRALDHLADTQIALEQQVSEDVLTGLATRRGLTNLFPVLRAQAERLRLPVFAMFVDVDGLKGVNDRAGHDAGDLVIAAAGDAIRRLCRASDLVVRWGGDEFVVVGIGDGPLLETLEQAIAEGFSRANPAPEVWGGWLSVGSAARPAVDVSLAHLIELADADMYRRRALRRAGLAEPLSGAGVGEIPAP
ncbi:MAG: diguanylate cyclase [Actinobacteria bacterium]|nr:diguanylate cyclase [Actinomycetota bacterium]MSW36715.1 diguanylate cyclase [Actinomycetota bacterium]MSX38163.1 diguanylate cyclase [Actinomycetota bacterium]